MTPEDLDTLREGWDFEAKFAKGRDGRGQLPKSLWETYSAMANAQGGRILLGARERSDGSLDLQGIQDIDRVERDLWNTLQNPQKVSANILTRQQVRRIEQQDRTLLLIEVPKAPRANRPVYINGSLERGTYLRVYDGDRNLSAEQARRMLADAIPHRDAEALHEYALSDLNAGSIRRYRELLAARRPDHPFLHKEGPAFLEAIGAARRLRDGSHALRPTWAGLWMLGSEVALREVNPSWHLSYRELPDDSDDPRRWLDRVYPDGTWPPQPL